MNSPDQDIVVLQSYLNGQLDPDESKALEERLLNDEQARRDLLILSSEETALTDWARAERVSASLDDGTFQGQDSAPERKMVRIPLTAPMAGWWMAAALFIFGILAFTHLTSSPGPGPAPTAPVADLVSSIDALWENAPPELNAPLGAGRYHLLQGSVDLRLAEGAQVRINGPARFDLRSSRHIHLQSGTLVATIPDEALGFTVTSPHSEIIDLGTEFGLSVNETGVTDVHVLDGLVEVRPARGAPPAGTGVMLAEGEARRFGPAANTRAPVIPVASRDSLLGTSPTCELGLRILRGSVRVVERITRHDLVKVTDGRNWIDLVPEKQNVTLTRPLTVSMTTPGSYRNFEGLKDQLPAGTTVNSYLLHFRPGSSKEVRGVIQFEEPIVALLCTTDELNQSDSLCGIPPVHYPTAGNPFRGLEPNGLSTDGGVTVSQIHQPDGIVLSLSRRTISIHTYAGLEHGYDQIRILTLAESVPPSPLEPPHSNL
jgi:hypothetical protein